ncbi:MAG TPA: response regulator [Ktedonobacterales bacterium]|jgi:CheY-like chemotaxis protein|nr:response regulator [Ktedonobacterales bacterium]
MFDPTDLYSLNELDQGVPADLVTNWGAQTSHLPQRRPVLVVDDDQDIRNVLRDLLSDEGYQVSLASDGAEGLRLLASASEPLVVLLDLMMPRVDGFEVCRRLAADSHLRDSHAVVLMSARRNLETADHTAVTATIPKPFEIDDLLTLVDRLASPTTP